MKTNPKFAVVLAGCGVYDGAEIHEAVLTLYAIQNNGGDFEIFAPEIAQHHVVNHLTGQPTGETRSVLVESARIARGNISPLGEFKPAEFDVLILPGGFGVAKNLCSFAFDGPDCRVDPDVEAAILGMHQSGKPIGALCIAPVILARLIPGVLVTIGQDAGTAGGITAMGGRHQSTGLREVVVDQGNRIVTTPCYMLDSNLVDIAAGADLAVRELIRMI
ncbi:MAG: isoprenoid biosynthesis glyoxalase ElbB [Bacteroidales bacterium]